MNELAYEEADRRFEEAIAKIKLGIGGIKPKLNSAERQILEFCHGRDMKEFLREEFEKHPIHLNESGELVGENPFDKERKEEKVFYDPIFGYSRTSEPSPEKPYIYENAQYE